MLVEKETQQYQRSKDGILRLLEEQPRIANFDVFEVGINDDSTLCHTNSASNLSGYLEFVTHSQPQLSVSIDWEFIYGKYEIVGRPFCNFKTVNQQGIDHSEARQAQVVIGALESQNWRGSLIQSLNKTYK